MKKALLVLLTLFLSAGLSGPALAYNPLDKACQNLSSKQQQQNAVCQDAANQKTGNGNDPAVVTIAKAAKIISIFVGVAAVILMITSGLSLITSGGNSEAVEGAKKRLTNAVVGLVLASLAWVIASYVINLIL